MPSRPYLGLGYFGLIYIDRGGGIFDQSYDFGHRVEIGPIPTVQGKIMTKKLDLLL